MKYKQVDTALSFLFGTDTDFIILQVRYGRDIRLLKDYINYKFMGLGVINKNDSINFHGKVIYFESIGNGRSGYGIMRNRLFFIDRKCDDYKGDILNV